MKPDTYVASNHAKQLPVYHAKQQAPQQSPKAMALSPCGSPADLRKIVEDSVKRLEFGAIKEKQLEGISAFVEGQDTFVSLPTGYGKSIIYAALPYVYDKLRGTKFLEAMHLICHICTCCTILNFASDIRNKHA